MSTGDILKKFRKNRRVNQQDLCRGIITRQTYSKIENNQQEPNYEILQSLLKKLNYEIDDFNRELEKTSEIEFYYTLLLKAKNNQCDLSDIETLYCFANQNKYNNHTFFQLYGRTVGHLHKIYPTIIRDYTDEDKQYFSDFISDYSKTYSLSDLKMLADFSAHLLDYKELILTFKKLPNFSPFSYGKLSEVYSLQVHKIYNNFCDSALFNNDLKNAKKMITLHKEFGKFYPNMRYLFYIKINELTIGYLETNKKLYLDELTKLADFSKQLGDHSTATSIFYQIKVLKEKLDYDSTNAISNE